MWAAAEESNKRINTVVYTMQCIPRGYPVLFFSKIKYTILADTTSRVMSSQTHVRVYER